MLEGPVVRGLRVRNFLSFRDARLELGWRQDRQLTITGKIALHQDQLGFPGPVPIEDTDSRSKRKKTRAPDDYSETTDNHYHLGITIDKDWGVLDCKFGYRDRDNPYILGYSPIIDKDDQTDEITEDTWQVNLTFRRNLVLAGRENRLLIGFDHYDTDYQREDKGTEKKNGDTRTSEWFFHDQLRLTKKLKLSFGYRESRFRGSFRNDQYVDFYTDPVYPPPVLIPPQYLYSAWMRGEDDEKTWHNNAYEAGLTWQPADDLTFFASYSKSYRLPNIDELALADDDLCPQKGFHWNVGSRCRWKELAEMTLTLFQMRIEDEIYYGEDPITHERLNRNYDEKTRRRGVEAGRTRGAGLGRPPLGRPGAGVNVRRTPGRAGMMTASLPLAGLALALLLLAAGAYAGSARRGHLWLLGLLAGLMFQEQFIRILDHMLAAPDVLVRFVSLWKEALLAGLACRMLAVWYREPGSRPGLRAPEAALLVLYAIAVVHALFSPDRLAAVAALRNLFEPVLLLYLARTFAPPRPALRRALQFGLILMSAIAALGLWQALAWQETSATWSRSEQSLPQAPQLALEVARSVSQPSLRSESQSP